jgi:hypothetical protein
MKNSVLSCPQLRACLTDDNEVSTPQKFYAFCVNMGLCFVLINYIATCFICINKFAGRRKYIAMLFLFFCLPYYTGITVADDGQKLIDLWMASRSALVSGVCEIQGTVSITVNESKKQTVQDYHSFSAFDIASGRYRFDRSKTAPLTGGKYLRTSEYQFHSLDVPKEEQEGGHIGVVRISRNDPVHVQIWPFDLRSLGFFTLSGQAYFIEFESFKNFLKKVEIISQDTNKNGITCITFIPNKYPNNFIVKLWIDARKGYTSPKIEYGRLVTTEATWEQFDKVWVPTTCSIKYGHQIPHNAITLDADFNITWKSVNNNESAKYLEIANLAPTGGTGEVVSWELGTDQPLRIETFSSEDIILPSDNRGYNFRSYFFMISGFILIFVSLSKMIYDRYTRFKNRDE